MNGYQTLFMPISADAVCTALTSSGESAPELRIASMMTLLLTAKAAASATPTASLPWSDERAMVPSTFSRMSLA
jgi:hypothetical protein